MYLTDQVKACFKSLIGWRNHYDVSEVPELDVALNETQTGEFYQDFHPALRLDIIKASLPPNRNLDQYLNEKIEQGILTMLSSLVSQKKYEKYAQKVLANDTILDRYGWAQDGINNTGRFVGFKIKPELSIGLNTVIKKLGLQLTQAQTLKIYLYHSSHASAIRTFDVDVTSALGWTWTEQNLNLPAEGVVKNDADEDVEIVGGVWILGYYQDDLIGQAIDYKNFDWFHGPCQSCDGGRRADAYRNLRQYMRLTPFYVPAGSLPAQGVMFNIEDGFDDYGTNFGMNFKVSAECDLSTFFCEHRTSLKQALGLTVTHSILQDIKFSQQINYIEESLKSLIIRDLEGDKDTNYINIVDQLVNELQGVEFDHSVKGAYCLPCDNNNGVSYGVA